MDWQANPHNIQAVKVHREYPNIIVITDDQGQDWNYLQHESGQLILGFPVLLFNQNSPGHTVSIFHPLLPGSIPILLKIIHHDEGAHK